MCFKFRSDKGKVMNSLRVSEIDVQRSLFLHGQQHSHKYSFCSLLQSRSKRQFECHVRARYGSLGERLGGCGAGLNPSYERWPGSVNTPNHHSAKDQGSLSIMEIGCSAAVGGRRSGKMLSLDT